MGATCNRDPFMSFASISVYIFSSLERHSRTKESNNLNRMFFINASHHGTLGFPNQLAFLSLKSLKKCSRETCLWSLRSIISCSDLFVHLWFSWQWFDPEYCSVDSSDSWFIWQQKWSNLYYDFLLKPFSWTIISSIDCFIYHSTLHGCAISIKSGGSTQFISDHSASSDLRVQFHLLCDSSTVKFVCCLSRRIAFTMVYRWCSNLICHSIFFNINI